MQEREIIITIDKDGHATIAVKGVSGPVCLDLTRDIIPGEVLEQLKTPEYQALGQIQANLTNKLGG